MQLDIHKVWIEVNWPAVGLFALALALVGLAIFWGVRRRPHKDTPPERG